MNRLLSTLLAVTALALPAETISAAPFVEANISSRFIIGGEQAILDLVMPGDADLDAMPEIPEVADLSIRPLGMGAQRRYGQGRRMELVVPYVISSYKPGDYKIPSIELDFNGEKRRTPPIDLRVLDEKSLKMYKASVSGREVVYFAAFHAIKGNPYVGEKQPVEIKLYFPADQQVEDWGIPEFERDGLSTWRFQPQPRLGRASLLARNYYAISYPSTMSANREGISTLGPATVRLQTIQRSADFGRAVYQPLNIAVPAIQLDSKPLPPGAPEGFENAIGQFEIAVNASETNVREGDPINLNMTVTGIGNLDTMKPPAPLDSEGWKLYDASAAERGEERREMWGQVEYRQFMRPLRLQQSVPPFRLVYFDPAKEIYETVLSDAIPLSVMPSTAANPMATAPQALAMPIEEMTDILGIVTTGTGLLAERKPLPAWLWQLIPALLVVGLLIQIFRRNFAPRLKKDPDEVARRREWREVERAPDQSGAFYRSVGHFIERWLGDRQEPVIAEVLSKRDDVCFRQETADAKLDRSERQRVLGAIRRLALPLVAFFFALSTLSGQAQQEDPVKLYTEGRYSEAAKGWLDSGPFEQLSSDTLFNIGNAAYRMGSPGEAALYYRRALAKNPQHPEARQNLRFLERKFGSITITRPDYQHTISRVPITVWKGAVWASLWILAIGILVFPATRPGAGIRLASIVGFVVAPLLAAAGAMGWYYFPDDASFAPPAEQVVVVADTSVVRTDAARTAPRVIDAPAGSLCRLLTKSGGWGYVAFTNDSRGWVPLVDIERLVPETKPAPPKLRPVQGSEGNA